MDEDDLRVNLNKLVVFIYIYIYANDLCILSPNVKIAGL